VLVPDHIQVDALLANTGQAIHICTGRLQAAQGPLKTAITAPQGLVGEAVRVQARCISSRGHVKTSPSTSPEAKLCPNCRLGGLV
jgi:hypothetical protein